MHENVNTRVVWWCFPSNLHSEFLTWKLLKCIITDGWLDHYWFISFPVKYLFDPFSPILLCSWHGETPAQFSIFSPSLYFKLWMSWTPDINVQPCLLSLTRYGESSQNYLRTLQWTAPAVLQPWYVLFSHGELHRCWECGILDQNLPSTKQISLALIRSWCLLNNVNVIGMVCGNMLP